MSFHPSSFSPHTKVLLSQKDLWDNDGLTHVGFPKHSMSKFMILVDLDFLKTTIMTTKMMLMDLGCLKQQRHYCMVLVDGGFLEMDDEDKDGAGGFWLSKNG